MPDKFVGYVNPFGGISPVEKVAELADTVAQTGAVLGGAQDAARAVNTIAQATSAVQTEQPKADNSRDAGQPSP